MTQPAIIIENLSKQYRLGDVGTGTLSHDLKRWWYELRGKEDPFAKIGETNDRTQKGNSEYVWALKDINLQINQGEAVGIIGRNGAGKSTLLKLLSKTTAPTTGSIKVKGRIASLLEVGTGFHPELSGRDNIYLNGAILGMRKREIDRKLDEIVDFAGIERYLDTPVKRYSSGMYVRLAFAVAAHLDSDILIVDEVLAVGDAEFQKKCLGKIGEVSQGQGRTVLFVSHNMNSIKHLCEKAIYLKNGYLIEMANTNKIIDQYISEEDNKSILINLVEVKPNYDKIAQILYAAVVNANGLAESTFDIEDEIFIEFIYEIRQRRGGLALAIDLYRFQTDLFRSYDSDLKSSLLEARNIGRYKATVKLPKLKAGKYKVESHIGLLKVEKIDAIENLSFEVVELSVDTTYLSYAQIRPGNMRAELNWQTELISESLP